MARRAGGRSAGRASVGAWEVGRSREGQRNSNPAVGYSTFSVAHLPNLHSVFILSLSMHRLALRNASRAAAVAAANKV